VRASDRECAYVCENVIVCLYYKLKVHNFITVFKCEYKLRCTCSTVTHAYMCEVILKNIVFAVLLQHVHTHGRIQEGGPDLQK
jgi:hypothetical protein